MWVLTREQKRVRGKGTLSTLFSEGCIGQIAEVLLVNQSGYYFLCNSTTVEAAPGQLDCRQGHEDAPN